MVGLLFGWWDVSDGFEESSVVEPVDVFEGGVFDLVEVSPGSSVVDQLGFVQPDHRLGEGVVAGCRRPIRRMVRYRFR